MKKYILVEWPECQYFMEEHQDDLYFDVSKNVWFIEESIFNKVFKIK